MDIPETLPEVMDLADQAEHYEAGRRAEALQTRRPAGPPSCGQCYACGERVEGQRRWCDADCRDDWERAELARRRRGGSDE